MSLNLTAIWAFLAGLLTSIGQFFGLVLKSGEKVYNNLSNEAKKAGVWASGILAIVNNDLNALPADVINTIKEKFPEIDLDVVHGFIDDLLNKISNVEGEVPLTLEDAIAALQKWLKQYQDEPSTWGIITKAAATILALLFSPESKAQEIDAAMEYIYHLIVKPHVTGAQPTANPDQHSEALAQTEAQFAEVHDPAQGSATDVDEKDDKLSGTETSTPHPDTIAKSAGEVKLPSGTEYASRNNPGSVDVNHPIDETATPAEELATEEKKDLEYDEAIEAEKAKQAQSETE